MAVETSDFFTFQKDTKPQTDLKNFWPPEDGFVWSTGSWCEVSFSLSVPRAEPKDIVEIEIDLDVFKVPPELEGQDVFIYVNGLRLASRFIKGRVVVLLEVAAGTLMPTDNILTIDTPGAARPSDYGKGDMRRLGVQMFSLQVRGV